MGVRHITILGGGPAGLATGYFAGKRGLPFTLYEAKARTGGNAITIQRGEFLFDTGAHRFHAKDPEITAEVLSLLGTDLAPIEAPSHIVHEGRFIQFPLTPASLLVNLRPLTLLRAGFDLARARAKRRSAPGNFEEAAIGMYGEEIARRFLLDYSEKLWGVPAKQLSLRVTGGRLRDLNPMTLLREMLLGDRSKPRHLEGKFYYPTRGFGMIAEALGHACGRANIRLNAPVEAVWHRDGRVQSIAVRGEPEASVQEVVNTLPLPLLVHLLDPKPPSEISTMAGSLRFRNLIVVALFLNRESITRSASIYVPDKRIPFTRIYEPRNRSTLMAPAGKTSLCAEYPCYPTDEIWGRGEEELIETTATHLERLGLVRKGDVEGGDVVRLPHAYPVLETGIEEKVEKLLTYLSTFTNLRIVGRNGRFAYAHVHDMLRFGLDTANDLAEEGA